MTSKPDNTHSESGIHDKLTRVSSGPGVYVMKDALKNVIYVGKARNLKKRLTSYFMRARQLDVKAGVLIKKIADFDTIITRTEKEALILESNLIKRHKPRYNVDLKDDKRYPSLRLDINSAYPNLSIVRKIGKDGALYFGPFTSAAAVKQTLNTINKTFKLRKCKTKEPKKRSRPCLNYQIGACLGLCWRDVDKDEYNEIVREVVLFLKGRTPALVEKIKKDMTAAAQVRDFEKASILRDKMFALKKTLEKQIAVTTDFVDRDVLAVARSDEYYLITLLFIRGGFLLGTRHFSFSETMSAEADMIGAFIRQYYDKTPFIPKEILIPTTLKDAALIAELLSEIKGQKVRILKPQRGEKVRLVNMAIQNAESALKDLLASETTAKNLLARLQKQLRLSRLPQRIECMDNSNISGTEAVAAMVVFEQAKPQKSAYRKYQ
jgi:excinuclease ABC subunit C